MTPDLPHFVADAIDHRLSEVGLHGADVPRLEGIEPPQHVEHGFLNEVPGIEAAPCRGRQPAVRPAFQLRHAALQEGFDRLPVAGAGAHHQLDRRLVAEQRSARVGPRWSRWNSWHAGRLQ